MVKSFFGIGFYYTHYQCLGHTTRVLTLIEAIKKKFFHFNIFNIQGSKSQDFLQLSKSSKSHSLPFPLFSHKSFEIGYKLNNLVVNVRERALFDIIRKLKLSVFITEYFPLGRNVCKYELLSSLCYLSKNRSVILSSAGYPVISKRSINDLSKFIPFYTRIFIHSPNIEVDYVANSYKSKNEKEKYLKVFDKYSDKITFTGYLIPSQLNFSDIKRIKLEKDKINILVMRGAGAYYSNIIATAIRASDLVDEDLHFTIIAGPSTTDRDWKYFQSLMKKKTIKNAILIKYTSQMNRLIMKCNLCICPASYNTSVLLLYFKKDSIIIPFEGYGNIYYREQPSRARLLKDFIGSSIINYTKLAPLKLAKEIERKIKYPRKLQHKKVDRSWFNGKEIFLKEFYTLHKKAEA